MSDQVAAWLKGLGLEQYAEVFADNDVDLDVLPDLTDADLRELGVSLGHRKRLIRAIDDLRVENRPGITKGAGAERRQLTVMFCDLVDSSKLSVRFDPEDMREIISLYQKCCDQVVSSYDGNVARYMGDGLLVYFGYPVADETDAERAIRAGLEVIKKVGALDIRPDLSLQVRVGIATGEVVVGDLIGTGSAQEHAVVGEAPNLAARLLAVADPDAVVVSQATRQLAGGLFKYEDLGSHQLKGFADPIPAWSVQGESIAESRFEAAYQAEDINPFVGRTEQTRTLTQMWQSAQQGVGSAALVVGEPGIGKSRLTYMMREIAARTPHNLVRYYCVSFRQNSALFPIIAELERIAQIKADDSRLIRLQKLESLVAEFTGDPARLVPLFAALLSVPFSDRYPALTLSPQLLKQETLDALQHQLIALAKKAPLLLIFEDLHWVDPTSLDLLKRIVSQLRELPILLIMTARPEFASPWVDDQAVTKVSLERLGREQGKALVAQVSGGKPIPEEVLEQILAKTDGVPLFVKELTKNMLESSLLEEREDRYELTGPLQDMAVPSTLQDSLMARLDRLEEAKEVAQIGAALGRRFSYQVMREVAPHAPAQLQKCLQKLDLAQLVETTGEPPEAIYLFRHALIQDAAYSTLLREKRHHLHNRIAEALESSFQDVVAAQPELLAHHYTQAGAIQKAIPLWHDAGNRARDRAAHAEAAKHLGKALELIAQIADDDEKRRLELGVQVSLGINLETRDGYAAPEVERTYDRARQLCQELGMTTEMVPVLLGFYVHHLVRAEHKLACELAEQCVQLSEESGKPVYLYESYNAYGHVLATLGRLTEAVDPLKKCAQLGEFSEEQGFVALSAQDPAVLAIGQLAIVLCLFGKLGQATGLAEKATRMSRDLGQPINDAVIAPFIAEVYQLSGDSAKAVAVAEKGIETASTHGFIYWQLLSTMHFGIGRGFLGDFDDGLAISGQALEALRMAGAVSNLSYFLAQMAAIQVRAGRAEDALTLVNEAYDFVQKTAEHFHLALLHCVSAECRQALPVPDLKGAESDFYRAVDVARDQGASLMELRGLTGLFQLQQRRGDGQKTLKLLEGLLQTLPEAMESETARTAQSLLNSFKNSDNSSCQEDCTTS